MQAAIQYYREKIRGIWIAHLVCTDLCAQGATKSEAKKNLLALINKRKRK